MNIVIEPKKCIGCGTCPALAPKSFKMNDATNKAEVINPPGDDESMIKMAVDSCPTAAITLA